MTELSFQEQSQLENAGPAINPWEGPAPVPSFRGFWHDDDYGYAAPLARILEIPGHAVAAGEGMLAGLAHDSYGLVDHVLGGIPGVHKYITEPILKSIDEIRQDALERTQALIPSARQVGGAIQAGHSLLTALTLAGFGGAAAGPYAAATTVGGGLGYERVGQLEAGGMPSAPAHLLGLETAATNAAGVLAPGLSGVGTNLAVRLLTGASANVGFGMANRYLDHVTLQAAGYQEMAQQQKVWDGTSMLFDAILGGGFGALGHLHQQSAARQLAERLAQLRAIPGMEDAVMAAQLGLRAQSLAPGIPADPGAAHAHQAALEKATADLLAGESVNVGETGVDRANFVPFAHPDIAAPGAAPLAREGARPMRLPEAPIDTSSLDPRETLLIKSFQDAGLLDAQRNVDELERALAVRLGQSAPGRVIAPLRPEGTPSSASPTAPVGRRWYSDRGAIPGEPAQYLDAQGDNLDSAKAVIVEHPVEGSDNSTWEALLPEGRSLGVFNTEQEAGRAAEAAVDGTGPPSALVAPGAAQPVGGQPAPPISAGIAEKSPGAAPPARAPAETVKSVLGRIEPSSADSTPQTEESSKADTAPAPARKTPPPGFKIHPDEIPRADAGSLTDAQRAIETRFAEQLARDPDEARRLYGELEDADGGRILNTDTARELSQDYLNDRSQAAAVHEPGSWLIKRMYAEMLKEAPKPGFDPLVLVMAGGTGAGKTSLVQRTAGQLFKRAQIIYDTNFDKLKGAIQKTNDALEAGKRVAKFYIFRDPAEALANGALTRAMKQEAKWGSGRTVPIEVHTDTHVGANHVNEPYAAHFEGHKDVDNNYIDNSRGPGKFAAISLEQIPRLEYNSTREQVAQTLEAEYAADRISDKVYRGFGGTGAPRDVGGTGAAVAKGPADAGSAGEPQKERGAGPADQLKGLQPHSVYTAAGRQVEVRPKLVEAASLTTSDQSGYPKELQPRQRGERTALAGQVQDMARNLRPEMLGQSAEADRGAPIVGADNVVESGNGRVMALRQVYDSLPDQALAYRKFLTDSGYELTGLKEPVLVRERITPLTSQERAAFTGEANVGSTATYSPVEQAQADAKLLDSGTLSKMAGSDLTTSTNAAFLRDFVSGLAPSERSSVMNPDGTISQAGVRRVQGAILAKAYGGTAESNATLGRLLESTDAGLKSTLNALVDAAPAYARLKQMIEDGTIGREFDIAPAIVQAVEDVARLQGTGQSLKEHFAQADIFSPRALATQAFYDKAGEKLAGRDKAAAALVRYADQAMAQRLNQGQLFGDPPATPQELLQNAGKPETSDMFGLRTKSGELAPGSVVVAAARSAIEEKPNLELPDENGQVHRAQAALLASAAQERTTTERAAPAIEAATDCFLRKGP